jgi:hypothetical protein
MPWHIWQDETVLTALRAGADREGVNACQHRLQRMYQAGEPVYMAADALKQLARGWALAEHEDNEAHALQRIMFRARGLSRPSDFDSMRKPRGA